VLPSSALLVAATFLAPSVGAGDWRATEVIDATRRRAAAADALAMPALGGGLPTAEPAAVGMSAARLGEIDRVVQRGLTAGGFPGAAVVVGRKGFAVWSRGLGTLDWRTGSRPVDPGETIYDLASLTKVVATTTAIMLLYDEGRLALDAPVVRYLPEFAGHPWRERITVEELLTHRSGLPAGLELWRLAGTPAQARSLVLGARPARAPGKSYEYSDLGPILLGFIVEAITGRSLDAFVTERVFRPLGMTDTRFRPALTDLSRIAPTEVTPPRGYPLRGEVHDENAHRLGGVAGHAGLFGTAADLSVFAQMMLQRGEYGGVRLIADSTVERFTRRTAGRRALGWDTCAGEGGCGEFLTGRAYGHTGYTGTSLWIDPDHDMFVLLLSNRVHAPRSRRSARVIMDVRHDLADASLLAVMDDPGGVRAMPVAFRADRQVDWVPKPPVRRTRSATRRGTASRTD
jgi:CubicO group peptidase (beta-lactamase class C family)